jgi:hypothetical protein
LAVDAMGYVGVKTSLTTGPFCHLHIFNMVPSLSLALAHAFLRDSEP